VITVAAAGRPAGWVQRYDDAVERDGVDRVVRRSDSRRVSRSLHSETGVGLASHWALHEIMPLG
jgi:hypothetical protein